MAGLKGLVDSLKQNEVLESLFTGSGSPTAGQQQKLRKLDATMFGETLAFLSEDQKKQTAKHLAYRDMVRVGLVDWLKRNRVLDANVIESLKGAIQKESEKNESEFDEMASKYIVDLIEVFQGDEREFLERTLGTEYRWFKLDSHLVYVQLVAVDGSEKRTIADQAILIGEIANSTLSELVEWLPRESRASIEQATLAIAGWHGVDRVGRYAAYLRLFTRAEKDNATTIDDDRGASKTGSQSLYDLLALSDISYTVGTDGIIRRQNSTAGSPRNTLVSLVTRNTYGDIDILGGHLSTIIKSTFVPEDVGLRAAEKMEKLRERAATGGIDSILVDYLKIKSEVDEASIRYIEDSMTGDQQKAVRQMAARRLIGVCGLDFVIHNLDSEFDIDDDKRERLATIQKRYEAEVWKFHERAARTTWSILIDNHSDWLEKIENAVPGFNFDEIENATLLFQK